MEELKSFYDLAEEVTPCTFSEEFLREFSEYMEESIRQSRINSAKAFISARDIIIF